MKKAVFPALLAVTLCLYACKSKPANQLSSADTTAQVKDIGTTRRVLDTIPAYQPDDTLIIPESRGLVNDFYRLFTTNQLNTLDSLVTDYEQKTTNEISIVTLTPMLVNHQNFEHYTLQMANRWGIGKRDKNNGILVAIAPELRRMRIQNGYGIQKILSNEETKTIIDSIFIPNFKKGDYFKGTMQGVIVLMERIKARQ